MLTRPRGPAQALAQGLEGDLLMLDLDRRQFGEGGSWGRQGESAARQIEMQGCPIGAVEGMNLALTGSHKGWGKDGEEQEVKTEVPRAAEASLYTGKDKGRLCALVRAQLVRAQHADAAPGAGESEQLCQWSPSCAAHCHPSNLIVQ
ncbi:hypothetical protein POSPLADRAFT_1136396 [Postia placenta MAD-698-R-SB12]|uniref:Uncharacterized protein n=1 Tax=Postia placenta MAD-698-R-SB12 TaxID=670580 RepID=A0A1X6NA94_9APHY|nr:hypothetical protein POSPLADRAFT_1136396 [Postia placenta MAD-698-R-SB12]OSX65569.1 hypothetical protein POSPLADRAFT_1136396 [Postia placenta MAD-698-R-SB12]